MATRAEVFGFAFQILEGKWINGITQDLHNGLTQYTSGHRDFVVTYPTTLIVREEETDINEVTQLAVSAWGTAPGGSGNMYLEIGRLDCGSCLSDYASFYNEVKKNIAAQGYVTTDISDKVMEFTREQGYSVNPIPMHGYIVTIQEGKMVYLIEVATESTSWEANKSAIHQIMASFQTR